MTNLLQELEKKELRNKNCLPTVYMHDVKKEISSAREELIKEIKSLKSPLWILDDFGEPTHINQIYLEQLINSVLGENQ